jgi:hypothetical protein
MNIKFLDKVYDQIISETRVIDDKVYTPFLSSSFLPPHFSPPPFLPPPSLFSSFYKHCKEIYSLNEQEIDYVWNEYKKGVTTLMEDKELSHQEKG